jgi:hypothetical protein
MGDWEREYVGLAAQRAVGAPARIIVSLSPYPRVQLECVHCEEPLLGNIDTRKWECPACEVTALGDAEVMGLMTLAVELLTTKLADMGGKSGKLKENAASIIEGVWDKLIKSKR